MKSKLLITFFLFSIFSITAQTDYLTGLSNPRGLAFDSSGILYVSEGFSGKIFKVTAANTSTLFKDTQSYINNIIFDNDGTLYVGDDFINTIFKIAPNGDMTAYLTGFDDGLRSPWALKLDNDGNLYYSSQTLNKIIKVTPAKVFSDYATEGFMTPEGMNFDSNGNLYVASRNNGELIKVAPNGTTTTLLTNKIGIRAVVIDINDIIYFNVRTGFATRPIIKYNPTTGTEEEIADTGSEDVNEMLFNANGDLFIASDTKVSIIENVVVLATDEFNLVEKTFNIYPNPTYDNIHVSTDVLKYSIRDLLGKIVVQSSNMSNTLDVSFLNSGIYFLEMEDINGNKVTKKIIKK